MTLKKLHTSFLKGNFTFIVILCSLFCLSNRVFSQCTPTIEFTTTLGTLSGCAPLSVSFKDPNNTSARIWDFGDGKANSGAQSPFHTFDGGVLGDTTYTVTLTKACNGGVSTEVTVTVFAKPKVNFIVDTASVCAINDQAKFTNLSEPGAYLWNFGDNTSTTTKNPIKAYNSGGKYDVSLKVTNSHGCEDTKTRVKMMTVNSLPSPDFTLNTYSGCAPLTLTIKNTTDTTNVQIKYWSWNLGDGSKLDSAQVPSAHEYTIPGTKNIVLTTTSVLGCKSTTSNTLSVLTSPSSDFSISPQEICSSDSLLVTYLGSAGPNANYAWSLNGGTANPGNGKGPHWVNWIKGGVKTISLTVTDSTCSSNTSHQATVLVSPIISLTASNDTICKGDEVTFTTSPASLVDYKLYKNGVVIDQGELNEYTTSTLATGDAFYVVATDVKGCKSKKSNVERMVVKIRPEVSLLSSDLDNIICDGDLVTFNGVPTNYSSYTFYNFSQPLQVGVSTTLNTNSITDNDSIFVEATNFNGCAKMSSNAFVMKVLPPLPKPVVNCGASTDSQVSFVWGDIAGASGYQVSVNGGPFQDPSSGLTGLTHVFGGLSSGDSTKIVVKAIGSFSCATSLSSKEKSCISKVCTPFTMKYSPYDTICNGETVKLRVDNISATNYSISWNGGTPGKDTTYTFKPTVDTELTAVIKDSSQLSYCSTFDATFRIKVHQLPVVTLNSSLSPINCQGNIAKLTATPSNYDFYTFYSGNQILQSSWKNYYTLKNVKNGVPLTVVAENFGCKATSVNTITNTVIQPLAQPVVNCGGSTTSSMEFVWDAIPNSIGYEISVDGGNWITPSSGSNGFKHILNGLSPGTASYVSVRALGATVCGNSKVSVQASCFTNPCTAITYTAPPNVTICQGTKTTLAVTGINIPKFDVSWNKTTFGKATTFSVKPKKDTVVTVIVRNSNELNCPSVTKYVRIGVTEQPNVSLAISPTSNCFGDSLSLIATPVTYESYKFYNSSSLLHAGYQSTFKSDKLKSGAQLSVVARNGNCVDTSNVIPLVVSIPLEKPVVNSGHIDTSTIEFVWDSIPNASGYRVSVNNGPYTMPSTGNLGLKHVISGLGKGVYRSLKVIAYGSTACGDSPESDTIIRHTTFAPDSVCTAINFQKSPNVSICEGDSTTVSIFAINAPFHAISWEQNAVDTITSYRVGPVVNDTIKVRVYRINEPQCPPVTKYIRVSVNPKPVVDITASIINDSICEGDPITFTADPNGYALYDFKHNGVSVQSSNNNEYALAAMTNSLNLTVLVKDDIGCTATSDPFKMTMVPKPVINLTSNAINGGICIGSDLMVSANPSNFKKYNFYDNGVQVQSSASTVYSQFAINKPYKITANAIHPFGCKGDITPVLDVQLFQLPIVSILSSDVDNSICDGDSYSVTASPSNLPKYVFFENATAVQTSGSNVKNYASLTVNKNIHVVATDINTCVSKSSDTISVVVNPIPAMTSSTALTLCSGFEVNIPLKSTIPSTFTWQAVNNANIIGESTTLQTTSSLRDSLRNLNIVKEFITYSVIPTSLPGCSGAPQTVTIAVNPAPVIAYQRDTICSGTAFTYQPQNGVPTSAMIVPANTTYTWATPTFSAPGTLSGASAQATGINKVSQTIQNSTNFSSNVSYLVTPKSGATGGCTGKPFTVDIVVNPTPAITNYVSDSICSNQSFTKQPVNGIPSSATIVPTNTTYTWSNPIVLPNGAVSGTNAQSIGQSKVSETLVNNTLNLADVNYVITPKAGKCIGSNFTIPMVVKPVPVMTNILSKSFCSDNTVNINLTPSVASNLNWSAEENTSILGESTSNQITTTILDKLKNQSNTVQTVNYTVTPTSTYGCVGQATPIVVSVNPVPVIADVTRSLCSEDTLLVLPQNLITGDIVPQNTSYTWGDPIVTPVDTISGWKSQLTPILSLKQQLKTTSVSGTITYTITPTSGDMGKCIGKPFKVIAGVHPVPNPTVSADLKGICIGTTVAITTSFDETNYPNTVYSWSDGQKKKNISVKPNVTTDYILNVTSNGCTSKDDTIHVDVDVNIPKADAGKDFILCRYDTASLQATGGKSYIWEDQLGIVNKTSATPKVAPVVTTIYKVHVINDYCETTDEIKVVIDKCLKDLPDKVPQVFTPNTDGTNDVFTIVDLDYFPKNSLIIFNRWGNIVYQASPYNNTWDGKNENGDDLPDGTYYYSLDIGNGHEPYKGFIVLTR
jgi:gliding motility-associated-like protein